MDNNNNHNQRQGVALCQCIINNILYTCIACLTLHMVPINNASIEKTRPTYARGKLEACGENDVTSDCVCEIPRYCALNCIEHGHFLSICLKAREPCIALSILLIDHRVYYFA